MGRIFRSRILWSLIFFTALTAAIYAPQRFSSFARTEDVTDAVVFINSNSTAAQSPGTSVYLHGESLSVLLDALNSTDVRLVSLSAWDFSGRDNWRLYEIELFHFSADQRERDALFLLNDQGHMYRPGGFSYLLCGDTSGVEQALRVLNAA